MPESSVSIAEIIAVVVISKKVSQHFAIGSERQNTLFHKKNFLQNKHFTSFSEKGKIMLFGIFFNRRSSQNFL
jgi:hypothetical protein